MPSHSHTHTGFQYIRYAPTIITSLGDTDETTASDDDFLLEFRIPKQSGLLYFTTYESGYHKIQRLGNHDDWRCYDFLLFLEFYWMGSGMGWSLITSESALLHSPGPRLIHGLDRIQMACWSLDPPFYITSGAPWTMPITSLRLLLSCWLFWLLRRLLSRTRFTICLRYWWECFKPVL